MLNESGAVRAPLDARVGRLEPRPLATNEAMRGRLHALRRLLQRQLASDVGGDLAVADGGERGQAGPVALPQQFADFLDPAAAQHRVRSGVGALAQRSAVGGEAEDHGREVRRGATPLTRKRLARRPADLDGADHAPDIARVYRVRRVGVRRAEEVVQRRGTDALRLRLQFRPQRGVRRDGGRIPPFGEPPNVLPRPADDDRDGAAFRDGANGGAGVGEKAREAVRIVGAAISIRWCGTAARSAGDGLAAPTDIPR